MLSRCLSDTLTSLLCAVLYRGLLRGLALVLLPRVVTQTFCLIVFVEAVSTTARLLLWRVTCVHALLGLVDASLANLVC